VRYVLEGSVRKAGNRVRITGQLIDAASGTHIWADRFDGLLEDIFELQDQVTSNVVGAISPALEQAEIVRAKRKVGHLQAYDYYLRGLAAIYRFTMETSVEALGLLQKAVELDPEFALAYATQAMCYIGRRALAWDVDRARDVAEAERVSRLALSLDRNDARVRAGVPPSNPFFNEVGVPGGVDYYYLWHFAAALVALMTRLSDWEADAALTGFTAFASLLVMIGLVVRLGGRLPAAFVVVALAATASLRPVLESLAPLATHGVIGKATGLGGWLFQIAWAPQHLASASCVVLAGFMLIEVARRDGWLAPFVLGFLAAAAIEARATTANRTMPARASC
jgi:hypothetical protein